MSFFDSDALVKLRTTQAQPFAWRLIGLGDRQGRSAELLYTELQ